MTRKLKVVCATGNGTASAFGPELFERLGVEVVPSHNTLDYDFPNYNPNPEAMEMLHDMAVSVKASGADFALGFDGDGDRCGVVDDEGEEIFADKVGVIVARDLSKITQCHLRSGCEIHRAFCGGSCFAGERRNGGLLENRPQPYETPC